MQAAAFDARRLTGRAAVAPCVEIEIGMVRNPALHVVVNRLKQFCVMRVIFAHGFPRFRVAQLAATVPKRGPSVGELST